MSKALRHKTFETHFFLSDYSSQVDKYFSKFPSIIIFLLKLFYHHPKYPTNWSVFASIGSIWDLHLSSSSVEVVGWFGWSSEVLKGTGRAQGCMDHHGLIDGTARFESTDSPIFFLGGGAVFGTKLLYYPKRSQVGNIFKKKNRKSFTNLTCN